MPKARDKGLPGMSFRQRSESMVVRPMNGTSHWYPNTDQDFENY
jgi:hypothetical protein